MMIKRTALLLALCLSLACSARVLNAPEFQHFPVLSGLPVQEEKRIVGYVIDLPKWQGRMDSSLLTHVNIAFFNPGPEGKIQGEQEGLAEAVANLRAKGVKVSLSIGGQFASETMVDVMEGGKAQKAFFDSLFALLESLSLDGVDLDLEGAMIKHASFNSFAQELSRRLKEKDYLSTAALTTDAQMGRFVDDKTIQGWDWINMMAYDQSGPNWGTPNSPHASLPFAEKQVRYWLVERKVPASKLVLGLPFYAWNWVEQDGKYIQGHHNKSYFTWGQLVKRWPQRLGRDELHVPAEYQGKPATFHVHLNSEATLRTKARAARRLGGLMIWQLAHDDYENGRSLLKLVSDVYRSEPR